MKKTLTALLLVFVMMLSLASSVFANPEISLVSILTCDDKTVVTKESGEEITVTYTLKNTTNSDNYFVSFHTNEIYYDPAFFEYIVGSESIVSSTNVSTKHQTWTEKPHNSLSVNGIPYTTWNNTQTVCSFKLKIIATEGSSEIYSKDSGVQSKTSIGGNSNYDLTLNKLIVNIGSPVDYDIEAKEYVSGKSIVIVYTDRDDVSFTYDGSTMYDVTSKYKKDEYKKAYAIVTDTVGSGTADDFKDDITFEYISPDEGYIIEASGYDINDSGEFSISDVIVVCGVFYVEPSYFPDYMPEILRADINNDKCVDKSDTKLCRDEFVSARNK